MSRWRTEGVDVTGYDIVVAGGGPAGSMAALTAADSGLSVLLVERDSTIGSPVRCAEGVDERGISEFFDPDPAWIATDITGYNLIAPDDTVVEMSMNGERGFILERLMFDRMASERAAKAGATVLTGVEVTGLSEYSDGSRTVTLKSESTEWTVKARIIVAADGTESRVGTFAGLSTHCARHDMETCAQVTAAGVDVNPHVFSMYFTREFAPNGYIWMFPKGNTTANIGLGISGDESEHTKPIDYLNGFLAQHFPRASIVSRTVGGISCTGGLKTIIADGVMVAGDAAQMANPITGGGIVNALIAGKNAGETAADVFHNRNGKAVVKNLAPYTKRCDDRFGKMNRRCYRLKEGILQFPNERLNAIAADIIKLPIQKRTPLRVLQSALWNRPKLLKVLAKAVFW